MASPSPSTDKTIHFIRHGESTFNQWRLRSILTFSWIFVKDPMIIDARLSAQGKLQVAALKKVIQERKLHEIVDVIITSPLTRAIETTLGGFDGCHIPIQGTHLPCVEVRILLRVINCAVSPLCREMLDTACDIGRQPQELAHEFGSAGIDTTSLADYWWLSHPTAATMTIPQSAEEVAPLRESVADLDARILAFLHLLRDLPQTNIAVVGHSSFIKRLTKATRKLANCEIHTTTLHQCLK
ncbi:hypothetical protein H257_02022 [Aphanomyces astaci]|uniref:Uncharacterized protein n=1 Tax=Aphanomyces astaci TaxID=112090 RepID=W4H6S8_APHAT|nr:hypothetical protein H257_02022 [Aphanomyces astaci]ETV87009.1 hypothetical protein H257_02022 [Aphanomyces astaci]KAF0717836.1 hypothetical protein AaE_010779 [Aphanomyces astaci]|eukprot:XP_009823808.1 hypothetical protein H257_02022 [Aphanomyces astaci]